MLLFKIVQIFKNVGTLFSLTVVIMTPTIKAGISYVLIELRLIVDFRTRALLLLDFLCLAPVEA